MSETSSHEYGHANNRVLHVSRFAAQLAEDCYERGGVLDHPFVYRELRAQQLFEAIFVRAGLLAEASRRLAPAQSDVQCIERASSLLPVTLSRFGQAAVGLQETFYFSAADRWKRHPLPTVRIFPPSVHDGRESILPTFATARSHATSIDRLARGAFLPDEHDAPWRRRAEKLASVLALTNFAEQGAALAAADFKQAGYVALLEDVAESVGVPFTPSPQRFVDLPEFLPEQAGMLSDGWSAAAAHRIYCFDIQ